MTKHGHLELDIYTFLLKITSVNYNTFIRNYYTVISFLFTPNYQKTHLSEYVLTIKTLTLNSFLQRKCCFLFIVDWTLTRHSGQFSRDILELCPSVILIVSPGGKREGEVPYCFLCARQLGVYSPYMIMQFDLICKTSHN